MQRKDLALRVLSTAAIMSIVTSIAAPAFAGTYYIGKGSIDVEATTRDGKQYVKVTQGETTYEEDESNEIVIKDGTGEADTTLKDAARAAATPAVAPAAGAATQELEAAGLEDAAGPAAGESQPDPDAAFNLSEEEEDSEEGKDPTDNPTDNPAANPTANPAENPTDDPTANPKKDVVFELDPAADPEPEQQATKLTLSTSATPAAETREATLADAPAADPAPTTPAAGSATTSTTNVIKVVNNWVGETAKELKIRLSNVNIKVGKSVDKAAMDVSGGGTTKVELDGQNVLDGSESWYQAGLRKQGEGTLIITDETDDEGKKITTPKLESDNSGSLIAKGSGSNGAAGIGGKTGESTKNITIEGYATVDATGNGNAAGIGGGGGTAGHVSGDAENIIIRGHSKVTATAGNGAAIGGGSANGSGNDYSGGSAKGIVICDHATVVAKNNGYGAAIGAAGGSGNHTEAVVTIGTAGATEEDVQVIATGSNGSAIGNGRVKTEVTIQGHATVQTASSNNSIAIGSYYGNVTVNINDNASIDTATGAGASGIGGGDFFGYPEKSVVVNIDGGEDGKVKLGENSAITGKFGAISATEVNIRNNVLLKMKQSGSTHGQYISVNSAEAAVGKRSNPAAGGLVNTIGNNTQLWYTDFNGVLQKIVHSKNLCTKHETGHKDANCTENGWVKYECTFEKNKGAVDPEHKDQWVENTDIDPNAHDYVKTTVPPTCGAQGYDEYICKNNPEHKYRDNFVDPTGNHTYGEWTTVKEATCTTAGEKKHTCTVCGHVETQEIPATGHHWVDKGDGTHGCDKPGCTEKHPHHWKDNGDGTHTCPDCGATEGQPFNTNSALELRVVDAEGMDQPFTVSQNGTLRTYTGAYDIATLTGDLNTLRYLQDHGAQTIQFVTNGQTSSFDINDLLAQGSGSEVFYLTHRGAEEPTLLLVEADHSDLVKD